MPYIFYQQKVQPVLVPATAEVVTPDKWLPTYRQPVRRLVAIAAVVAGVVAPVATSAETTRVDRYQPTCPQPSRAIKRAAGTAQVGPLVAPTTPVPPPAAWLPTVVQPSRALRYALGSVALPLPVPSSSPSFSPGDVAGLMLWVDASVGVYKDTPPTLPATADNDPVAQWNDRSAGGNNMVRHSANAIFKTAIQNGLPAVRHPGTDYFNTGTIAHGIGTGDFYWGGMVVPGPADAYMMVAGNGGYNPALFIYNNNISLYWGTDFFFGSGSVTTVGSPCLIEVWRDAGTVKAALNGVQCGTTNAISTSIPDAPYYLWGEPAGNNGTSDILEWVFCSGSGFLAHQVDLRSYFNAKFFGAPPPVEAVTVDRTQPMLVQPTRALRYIPGTTTVGPLLDLTPPGISRYVAPILTSGTGTLLDPFGLPDLIDGSFNPGAALTSLVPGDTLYFRGGTYPLAGSSAAGLDAHQIIGPTVSGSSSRPITFTVYPGEAVNIVLTGGIQPVFGTQSPPLSYVRFIGFTVHCSTGAFAISGTGNEISHCDVIGQYVATTDNHEGVYLVNAHAAWIHHNNIHGFTGDSNNSSGIKLYTSSDIIIEDNYAHDNTVGIFDKDSGTRNTYRRNYIAANMSVGFYGNNQGSQALYDIYDNVFGPATNPTSLHDFNTGTSVYNNLMLGTTHPFGAEIQVYNQNYWNNIVLGGAPIQGYWIGSVAFTPSGPTAPLAYMDYNVYDSTTTYLFSQDIASPVTYDFAGFQAQGFEVHSQDSAAPTDIFVDLNSYVLKTAYTTAGRFGDPVGPRYPVAQILATTRYGPEVIAPSQPTYPQPDRTFRRASGTTVVAPVQVVGPVVTADRWAPTVVQPSRALKRAAGTTIDVPESTSAEAVTVDRVQPTVVQPSRKLRYAQGVSVLPPPIIAPVVPSLAGLTPTVVQPSRTVRYAAGGTVVPVSTLPATVTVDRWAPTVVQPRRTIRYASASGPAALVAVVVPPLEPAPAASILLPMM